ncbi:hypothetical protein OSTOST_00741 [Ostertagia ostertagi]
MSFLIALVTITGFAQQFNLGVEGTLNTDTVQLSPGRDDCMLPNLLPTPENRGQENNRNIEASEGPGSNLRETLTNGERAHRQAPIDHTLNTSFRAPEVEHQTRANATVCTPPTPAKKIPEHQMNALRSVLKNFYDEWWTYFASSEAPEGLNPDSRKRLTNSIINNGCPDCQALNGPTLNTSIINNGCPDCQALNGPTLNTSIINNGCPDCQALNGPTLNTSSSQCAAPEVERQTRANATNRTEPVVIDLCTPPRPAKKV